MASDDSNQREHEAAGTRDATTGHEWDGIREYDTPLPRWWLYTFYACIIWSVVYWLLMPAWPLVSNYTRGLLGYSQRQIVTEEVAAAKAARAEKGQALLAASLPEIENNPNLLAYALDAGKAAFGDNCAPCHGSGAQGGKGYPNLNDDDWLWGGTLQDIYTTIRVGIRSTSDETRSNDMMAFLKDGILTRDQVNEVTEYVLTLSGQPADKALAEKGKVVFEDNCVVCHGTEGKGNQALGAPNLTDQIWLYGGDRATIRQTVSYGRKGVMPTWGGRLDPVTIKSLAVYVHALGGGQ